MGLSRQVRGAADLPPCRQYWERRWETFFERASAERAEVAFEDVPWPPPQVCVSGVNAADDPAARKVRFRRLAVWRVLLVPHQSYSWRQTYQPAASSGSVPVRVLMSGSSTVDSETPC